MASTHKDEQAEQEQEQETAGPSSSGTFTISESFPFLCRPQVKYMSGLGG